MLAVWYDRQGPAAEVLRYGDLTAPEPGIGEVRIQVTFSGVNPGDTKKRRGWLGSSMPFSRVIPHSDGSGVINAVGPGVDPTRLGRRVWIYGAQSYRPCGTAAELCVVPDEQAVDLPDNVSDLVGACLGIPGITAHRAIFADGPIDGSTVLVHGVLGAVAGLAAQLGRWAGATIIGTVRRTQDIGIVSDTIAEHIIALDRDDAVDEIRSLAPTGVDRIVEVSLSDNADLDAAVIRVAGVIAAYGTSAPRPEIPFWPMLFDNVTIRLLGSDDFPTKAKQRAAEDLTSAARDGFLNLAIGVPHPLDRAAQAHDLVDQGTRKRAVLAIGL